MLAQVVRVTFARECDGRAGRAEHADDARASGLGAGAQLHPHHDQRGGPCPQLMMVGMNLV